MNCAKLRARAFPDLVDLTRHGAPLDGVADGDAQPIRRKGLEQEIEGAFPHGVDGELDRALRRHHHDDNGQIPFLDLPHDVEAIAVRQVDVDQQDMRAFAVDLGEGRRSCASPGRCDRRPPAEWRDRFRRVRSNPRRSISSEILAPVAPLCRASSKQARPDFADQSACLFRRRWSVRVISAWSKASCSERASGAAFSTDEAAGHGRPVSILPEKRGQPVRRLSHRVPSLSSSAWRMARCSSSMLAIAVRSSIRNVSGGHACSSSSR